MPQPALFPGVTIPKNVSGASSFDIILEKCRDLVSDRVSAALTKMFDEADEALTAFGSVSRDPETSKLYEVARNTVLSQREAIVTQFRMCFLRELHERVNRVKKIGDKFAEIDLSSREAVAEDDLNESRKFDAMASRLLHYCDEELLALDQRVGVLVGDADLQSEDNPFTPQTIVDAYKHTCRQIDSNVDVRMVLLKLFDDYVLDEIRGVYKAVNALLIKNSILPKIRFSGERGKDGAKAPSGESRPDQSSETPVTTNVPRGRRKTDQESGKNQMDAMTLDIMAMLFDELFDDPKIPITIKGLISRLHTPMLKLVIADKSFFSRKSHPARQMLEKLGELSTGLPADVSISDPIYEKLETIIESLVEGYADDSRIFERVCQQFDTLIVEIKQRAKEETLSIGEQNDRDDDDEEEEKLALAQAVAEAEIKARLRASDAPQPIVAFLEQHWVRLLVAIHIREGEESGAWKNALETADLLLWSGERKETMEARSEMVAVVPDLLKRLADGLAYAGIDDAIRVHFFSDLRKLHAALIGRSTHPGVEKPGVEKPNVEKPGVEKVSVEKRDVEKPGIEKTGGEKIGFAGTDVEKIVVAGTDVEKIDDETASVEETAFGKNRLSDTAEELDFVSARDTLIEADPIQEARLDFIPSARKTAPPPEQADTATAGTVIREVKSPTTRAYEQPSAQLRAEMDKVMDATRTMFSDVDRFIMLGKVDTAINVLDFRIKREPNDRDSWIKLMAIYREEGMEDDFYRSHAAFRKQFGDNWGS